MSVSSPSVPQADGPDIRRPSWLNDEPRARDAGWPRRSPRLPADDFYARLVAHISVPLQVERSISSWIEAAGQRVADAIRPHAADVDTVICGSFSARTYIASELWDVDLAVRLKDRHHSWDEPTRAVEDLRTWLSHAFEAHIEATDQSVRITSRDAPDVDVLPCWRAPRGRAGLVCPHGLASRHVDPAGHRDLLAARDASLGAKSGFLNVIKIVKHLNQRWGSERGTPPLTTFHIEALALTHCTRPFSLAEEVAEFLEAAAQLVRKPLQDPLGVGDPIVAGDAALASVLLREAARDAEAALMTADFRIAEDILAALFGVSTG